MALPTTAISQPPPTKEFIANKIAKVRNRNQTRRSKDKANNLTEYRQMLHATFEKKQYGRIIKLLTGDFSPQSPGG